jgi:hypothetical protein
MSSSLQHGSLFTEIMTLDVYLKTAYANGRWGLKHLLALQLHFRTRSANGFIDDHISMGMHKSRFFKRHGLESSFRE